MSTLQRFLAAQATPEAGFEAALRELRAGRKRGHWIWYILPQLVGLGRSPMAQRYGLEGVEEAVSFLEHPELRRRLLLAVQAVEQHVTGRGSASIEDVMGSSIDAQKLVSSMTLFGGIAARLGAVPGQPVDYQTLAMSAAAVLAVARRQGLPPCHVSLEAVRAWAGRLTIPSSCRGRSPGS